MTRKTVLALTKYGDLAASTRQRFLQFRPALAEAGLELSFSPMLDNDYLSQALVGKKPPRATIAKAYWRRVRAIFAASQADCIWLQYEFLPYWPALAEVLSAKRVRKPIVVDLDDAIFHRYDESSGRLVHGLLGGKLESVLSRADVCLCGNAYLQKYAARFCRRTMIVPTVVDTDLFVPGPPGKRGPLTIGWIGSPSTWHNVQPVLPVIKDLVSAGVARFLVIGAGARAAIDGMPGVEFRDWKQDAEVSEIQSMDIGIMPLVDEPFERGKSGYKLIQYMACGIPVIASPVGVNGQIVKDGANGFLAPSQEEWSSALSRLIADPVLRNALGNRGRTDAVAHYSLESQEARVVSVFKSLV